MATDERCPRQDEPQRRLRAWLEKGEFELRIAGPYASKQEGFAVDCADLRHIPKFNKHPGNDRSSVTAKGIRSPLLLPSMIPLTVAEIGLDAGSLELLIAIPAPR